MKKIVFCDYDGTIYTEDGKLGENVAAIRRWHDAGGKFVIATGRGFASAQKVVREYDIPFDYCIMNNGALTVDANWNLLLEFVMSHEEARAIFDFAKANFADEIEGFYYYGLGEKSVTPEEIITKIRVQTRGRDHAPMRELATAISKRFSGVKAHETLTDMYPLEQFPDANYQIVDIVSARAGKERAIEFILEREGLEASEATAVGDGANDMEMIEKYDGYAILASAADKATTAKTAASVAQMLGEIA